MWVSGSLIRSSTWRSSSVSAPCISSSICLPSSVARSRTMRGSFCQALPIGCMRVFMTPSCSSAVTLDSRCSGTLNSVSSLRRAISSNWLRVSTSSETIVIRCSSVSTLTRIDWLATLSLSCTSPSALALARAAFFGASALGSAFASTLAGSAFGAGAAALGSGAFSCAGGVSIAVSRKARSSSSSDTSPGRSGRSRVWSIKEPCVTAGAAGGAAGAAGTSGGAASPAAIAAMPRSTIASSSLIRSRSSPSGSDSLASSCASRSLMRSMVVRISVTASPVTGMPSRNLPIRVSAACASASSRGRPRKPQVPLIVCTRRKMLSRILALFGSCSNRTN